MLRSLVTLSLCLAGALAQNSSVEVEKRTIDEIYKAALAEGGVVTLWHGGDEKTQQNSLKSAFEARFPGMTLNVTVDLSKYHDGKYDEQLAANNVYIDSIILQTLHDFPRWKEQGALLNYAPLGFEKIWPQFRDTDAAYYGVSIIAWASSWNTDKLGNGTAGPIEFTDFLEPQYKDKLVLTYPNDDDAVLYAFKLILDQYGEQWFDQLLAQNPRWVRGTATPLTLVRQSNNSYVATFTSSGGLFPSAPISNGFPSEGKFVSWDQTGAITKNAPHPEGAKLLHSYLISERQANSSTQWTVRQDATAPGKYPAIMNVTSTDPASFGKWMQDRAAVERLRFFFEDRIGTAQGLSPLIDDL